VERKLLKSFLGTMAKNHQRLKTKSLFSRVGSRKGSETIEFTLAFLPLVAMLFLLIDSAWAIFVKSTLEYAVRMGVRQGITITGTQATAAHSNQTAMVKSIVQNNSMGLLSGSTGLGMIKVHYFLPPAPNSDGAMTDVSTLTNGNAGLNLMQVSIEGFTLTSPVPRIFSWKTAADGSTVSVGAIAADLIEPGMDSPPIGTAP
jgi:Flp pilus assembly protein TadG